MQQNYSNFNFKCSLYDIRKIQKSQMNSFIQSFLNLPYLPEFTLNGMPVTEHCAHTFTHWFKPRHNLAQPVQQVVCFVRVGRSPDNSEATHMT